MNRTTSPRCLDCLRPHQLCFCDRIPAIANRTELLILQHRRERCHPFNTARIVRLALNRCRLLADHNHRLADQFAEIKLSERAGLLFPSPRASVLTELPSHVQPDQLVIVDGTWHHAKGLLRDIPALNSLPHYSLRPSEPGRYRIRREPNAHALSTVEATVAALRAIEPETDGLDRLLSVFDHMIETQISHSGRDAWRHNRRRRPGATNVPRALCGELDDVVVAYGEQEPGIDSRFSNSTARPPIYWVAERPASGERFRCAIESASIEANRDFDFLRLPANELNTGLSIDAFRKRWKAFLRPTDQLAVYHPSTLRSLQTIHADFIPTIILKSIDHPLKPVRRTLDDLLADHGISPQPGDGTRASARLANAVAYVRLLNRSCLANMEAKCNPRFP